MNLSIYTKNNLIFSYIKDKMNFLMNNSRLYWMSKLFIYFNKIPSTLKSHYFDIENHLQNEKTL